MECIVQRGLEISRLTLGTVQLGLDYGINNAGGKPSAETAYSVLNAACEGGITVIDTSSDYGTSEQVVGDFFKQYKGKKPLIVTKFKIEDDHSKVAPVNEVEKRLRAQVYTSLERLGYDKLPLLMLHRESELFDYGNALPEALKRLQAENLIDKVGVSLNSSKYVKDVVANDLYEAVQLPLNMMDVKNVVDGGLDLLKKNDILVGIRSVFLQGLFFRDPETLPEGVLSAAKEPLRKLRKLSEEENMSIAQIAISFIRDLEGVTTLVLGSETPDQVKENVALANCRGLSDSAKSRVLEMFKDVDERVLMPWTWNKK